jgi:hypothetical protein
VTAIAAGLGTASKDIPDPALDLFMGPKPIQKSPQKASTSTFSIIPV